MIWFAVFHPKEPHHWWARKFHHVSLAGFSNETWLHLDLGRGGFKSEVFFAHDEVHGYLSYLTAHHVVLRVRETSEEGLYFGRPMTCVNFVKHVLGIRSRALLPDQLFTSLIRDHNAELMNETQSTERDGRAEGGSSALGVG